MMARDGFVQHYTPFGIPASGILLDPKADLSVSAAICARHGARTKTQIIAGLLVTQNSRPFGL